MLEDFAISSGIMLASVLVAWGAYHFIKKYLGALAQKTKTTLDDRLIASLRTLLYVGILLTGLYLALVRLELLSPYLLEITHAFRAIALIIAALLFLRVSDAVLGWYVSRGAGRALGDVFVVLRKVLYLLVAAVAIILVLGEYGVEITPLLASLGIAGLAIALALQDTLSNFFSGVYISAERPVKIGDFVTVEGGVEGFVSKVGWRSTYIRTLQNAQVIIPNSKLAQNVITNYYLPEKKTGVIVPCSVAYGTDLEKVKKVAKETAKGVMAGFEGSTKDFEPLVIFKSFGSSGIDFITVLALDDYSKKGMLTSDFIAALHSRFMKERIEIPYPKTDVYLYKKK